MSKFFKRLLLRYQDTRILDSLRGRTAQGGNMVEPDLDSQGARNTLGGYGSGSLQGVKTMHAQRGGDVQGINNAMSQE